METVLDGCAGVGGGGGHGRVPTTSDGEPNYELIEALVQHICSGRWQSPSDAARDEAARATEAAARADDGGDPGAETDGDANAILIFLPGAGEIATLLRRLKRAFGDASRFRLLELHGSLPAAAQKRCFVVPPRGVRKIVLATNIAETSVTISDVRHVIDSGRVKEMRYEAARQMGVLEQVRVGKHQALATCSATVAVAFARYYKRWHLGAPKTAPLS